MPDSYPNKMAGYLDVNYFPTQAYTPELFTNERKQGDHTESSIYIRYISIYKDDKKDKKEYCQYTKRNVTQVYGCVFVYVVFSGRKNVSKMGLEQHDGHPYKAY